MYEFHTNKDKYFQIQHWVTSNYIIPFITEHSGKAIKGKHVLEVGCGEAGVLKAFVDQGATGMGIELSEARCIQARTFLAEEIRQGKAEIVNENIYNIDPTQGTRFKFDIIILKDVIEHIPNQLQFLAAIRGFLKTNGVIFFAYPPWYMPFGGHQQICKNKILGKMPWLHLLPMAVYQKLLEWGGEDQGTRNELKDIKETGISIDTMYTFLNKADYTIVAEKYWLINPIYVKKFDLKPLALPLRIPYLRNFYITAHYVLFKA